MALANDNGKYQRFSDQHSTFSSLIQAHGGSGFLPWHRHWLNELELQVRTQPGCECFTLLYWNWGKDVDDNNGQGNYNSYSVLDANILGTSGDPNDNYCVTDGLFTAADYTPNYCPNNNWRDSQNRCCLRRITASDEADSDLYDSSQNEAVITTFSAYGPDSTTTRFRRYLEYGPHGVAHCRMGDCSDGHLGGDDSPTDPIFPLLHGQIDYMYALWQDYNDYDLIDKANINSVNIYNPLSDLDDVLSMTVLSAEPWAIMTGQETIRDMHSIQDLGYKYDYGSFIDDVSFPTNNLNSNWFVDVTRRRRRRLKQEQQQNNYKQFRDLALEQLKEQYGDDANTKEGRRELVKTLAKMTCQFRNKNRCERPAYFDDCSDMELIDNGYGLKPDINITKEELIEKVKDYPCMVETRELLYVWSRRFGTLSSLCRGDFDRFCDKDYALDDNLRTENDQCEAKGYQKKRRGKRQEAVIFDNYLNNDNNNNNNFDENHNEYWDLFKSIKLNGIWDKMVFISVLAVVVLLIICICYKQIRQRKDTKQQYNKVKYINDDDEINDVEHPYK